MINFKKVVSMAVVLSLMLGACGKNPARRDAETDDNSANNKVIESIAADTNTNPKDKPSEHWTRTGVGARVGVVFGIAILLTVTELVLFACRDFSSLPGNPIVLCSTGGALVGMVMAGGIVGLMSRAAGDESRKVTLNAVIAGLVTAVVVGIGIGVGTGMVRRAGVGSAQLRAEAREAEAEWHRTSDKELLNLVEARMAKEAKLGARREDVMKDNEVSNWEGERSRQAMDAGNFKREAEAAKKEKKYIIGDEVKVWRKATEKFQKVRELQKERKELIPEYAYLNTMVTMSSPRAEERREEEEEEQLRESKRRLLDFKIQMLELERDTCIAVKEGKTEWAEYERLTGGRDMEKQLKEEVKVAEAKTEDMDRRIQDAKNERENMA